MNREAGSAAERCELYRAQGFHCSESVIRACNDLLQLNLSPDVIRCACGFRGGGGGAGGRCGVIEAGIILLSHQYGRDSSHVPYDGYSLRVRQLIRRFELLFGSTECRDLNPAEMAASGNCGRIFRQGAELVMQCLCGTEAP